LSFDAPRAEFYPAIARAIESLSEAEADRVWLRGLVD